MADHDRAATVHSITDFEPLFTAEEGFVAFERAVLGATSSVIAGFRVFDTATKLRSSEARAIGTTWFDLILNRLDAGVTFEITISDFDPVVATNDHRRSWRSAQQLAALDEISTGGRLRFSIAQHPAEIGLLPKLALQGKVRKEMEDEARTEYTPGLRDADTRALVPLRPATHHQKLAVIDEEVLYVGGLDLNERRYDTLDHDRPAQETWHDVQALVKGPVVTPAVAHLRTFRAVCAGHAEPGDAAPGFLRTLSRARSTPVARMSPDPLVNEIETAHLEAIARSKGPLFFETQFFRHVPLAETLAEAAVRDPDLDMVLVLPASPEDVAFDGNRREDAQLGAQNQLDALNLIREGFGERAAVLAPAQRRADATGGDDLASLNGAPIVYVHSKVSLFGVSEAIVSSANLNGRSFRWDTEVGIHLTDETHVRCLWHRVLDHWLGDLSAQAPLVPGQLAPWIWQLADQNRTKAPDARDHFLMPYPRWRDEELAKPLPIVPDEMV